MYNYKNIEDALEINDLLFKYDKDRAKNQEEINNASKEWDYRFNRIVFEE